MAAASKSFAPEPSAPPLESWEFFEATPPAEVPLAVATPMPPPTARRAVPSAGAAEAPNGARGAASRRSLRDRERTRATAAGVAAGVVGLLLGSGPALALLVGGGVACAAARGAEGTVAGDVARAVGDVALTARDRARDVNDRHGVVDVTRAAAGAALMKARELYARQRISEGARRVAASAYGRAAAYSRDRRILERTAEAVRRFVHHERKLRAEGEASAGHMSIPAVVH